MSVSGSPPTTPRVGTPSPRLQRRPIFRSQASVVSFQSDPTKPPQYFIMNPMHVLNLTANKTKSGAVRVIEAVKAFSERWFSHVLLLLVLLGYAALGALIFQLIEEPYEAKHKETIIEVRQKLIDSLQFAQTTLSNQRWSEYALERLKEFESQVRVLADEANIKTAADRKVWTFWGSMFYCGTVFTTIGYGNIAPSTMTGQVVTIFYAIIGIPLLLMVLADLGKLFTRWIKSVFFWCRNFYRTGQCRQRKRQDRKGPVQYVAFVWQKVNDTMAYVPYPAYMKPTPKPLTTEGDGDAPVENNAPTTPESVEAPPMDEEIFNPEDEEFNLPVSLALLILSVYMTVGACIFTMWETWSFTESFYFVFVSMSTIGFGDYVPEHPMYMMATFIYLLFGLALTSMCINVVQEKLSAMFTKAKLQLGQTIGFDPNMIMSDEEMPQEDLEEEDTTEAIENDKAIAEVKSKGRRGSKMPPKKEEPEIDIDELIKTGKGVDTTKKFQPRNNNVPPPPSQPPNPKEP